MGTQSVMEPAMADTFRRRRQSTRLKGFDYAQVGAYFVTIVTQNRLCLFGCVAEEKMLPNQVGKMIETIWGELPFRYPRIHLDSFVVMPNHVHGIIVIDQPAGALPVGTRNNGDPNKLERVHRSTTRVAPTLGDIVGAFKSRTTVEYTRRVRSGEWDPFHRRLWQRNYYEHVIRDSDELNRAREYIFNNPPKWESDRENPAATDATR